MVFSRLDKQNVLLIIIILLISSLYFAGVSGVPFHPDESTNLFMSSDFEWLFKDPSRLVVQELRTDDLRQYYRLVDPPLTRYFAGLGRSIAGLPALPTDWNWSENWDENQSAGALPNLELLLAGRFGLAFLFPFTLWGAFLLGKTTGYNSIAWVSLILTATNSLILLHTRRVMAESVLIFGCIISLLVILTLKKHRWLAAIPIAFAFNAKFSAAPLLIAGIIAIFWSPPGRVEKFKNKIVTLAALLVTFVFITFALNPVYWSKPVDTLQAAITARKGLMSEQVTRIGEINPSQTPTSITGRLLAMGVHLFIAPPAIADVGNYLENTAEMERSYLQSPFHTLFRGSFGGAFLFVITLSGLIFWTRNTIRGNFSPDLKRSYSLFLLTFIIQTTAMLISIPLIFQRYYLPLIPFIIIFIAYGFWVPIGGLSNNK